MPVDSGLHDDLHLRLPVSTHYTLDDTDLFTEEKSVINEPEHVGIRLQ